MTQQDDDESGELPELSNRELLRVLMQEIVDTRNELKQDFKHDINRLERKIDTVSSDFQTLRREVHQNQSAFIVNHATLEKRVTTLEVAVFQ